MLILATGLICKKASEAKLALVVSSYPRSTDILRIALPVNDTLRDRDSPGGTSVQRRCCSWTFYWFESIFADVVWLSRCWKLCVFWVLLQTNYWPPRFHVQESWQDSRKMHGTTSKENNITQTIDKVWCLLVPLYWVCCPDSSWLKKNRPLERLADSFSCLFRLRKLMPRCRSLASSFLPWQRGWDIEAAIDTTSKPLQHQTLVHVFVTICWIAFSFSRAELQHWVEGNWPISHNPWSFWVSFVGVIVGRCFGKPCQQLRLWKSFASEQRRPCRAFAVHFLSFFLIGLRVASDFLSMFIHSLYIFFYLLHVTLGTGQLLEHWSAFTRGSDKQGKATTHHQAVAWECRAAQPKAAFFEQCTLQCEKWRASEMHRRCCDCNAVRQSWAKLGLYGRTHA